MQIKPIVSVVMITYGHENYIRQAIEGVFMQECDFEIELILANDCSPDKTDIVIQDILKTHPKANWIKYFNHEKNLGMMPNFIFALKNATGKYIALCEGDDYWIDKLKLQKQVDFLERNLDYVLIFHKVKILDLDGNIKEDFITKVPENHENIETLAQFGNYIHTPSVVFRNIIKEFPFEFEQTPIGDFFLYLLLAQHGKIKYLKENMCVYRYGVGVFSAKSSLHLARTNLKLLTCLISYFNDEKIKKIIFERHSNAISSFENNLNNQFKNSFVSNHLFFRCLNFLLENKTKPNLIFMKIYNRFIK